MLKKVGIKYTGIFISHTHANNNGEQAKIFILDVKCVLKHIFFFCKYHVLRRLSQEEG